MRSFEYHNPTRVVFGPGRVKTLTDRIAPLRTAGVLGERCMVVYGSDRVLDSGLLGLVEGQLKAADCAVVRFGGVRPNPRLDTLTRAIEQIRDHGVNWVLALGGGSVIDLSKAAAAGVMYPGEPWDMVFHGQAHYRPPTEALPMVAIPTLAATGSEMDPIAVITNTGTRQKSFIRSDAIFPVLSILDPELTVSVPPDQTAYGVSDMISHVTETCFNGPGNTPLQDGFAESVVRVALKYGALAVKNGADIRARMQLQWAATVALNGWVQAGADGPFVVHAIEHVLSAWYDIAHGAGLAVLNPAWMLWAGRQNPEKFASFARRVLNVRDENDADAAARGAVELRKRFQAMGLPVTLQELGVSRDDWTDLADTAIATVGQGHEGRRVLPAIRPMDRDAIVDVFMLASREEWL